MRYHLLSTLRLTCIVAVDAVICASLLIVVPLALPGGAGWVLLIWLGSGAPLAPALVVVGAAAVTALYTAGPGDVDEVLEGRWLPEPRPPRWRRVGRPADDGALTLTRDDRGDLSLPEGGGGCLSRSVDRRGGLSLEGAPGAPEPTTPAERSAPYSSASAKHSSS